MKRHICISTKSKGVLFILLSAFSFSLMSLFIKLSGDIPTLQKCFFRNLIAAFIAFFTLKKQHIPLRCEKKSFPYVFGRALSGTIGVFFNFYAIDHLHIADASMLNKLSPFFAIVFSIFILKERIAFYQTGCVFTALIGALFILKPDGGNLISFPALIALLGGMAAGLAYTLLRKATSTGVPGAFIVLFFSTFSCLCSLPYCIFHFTPMTPLQLFFLIMTGIAAAFGQFFITAAYTYAPAKELSVYDYSNVIFSAILGFFFLGEVPDLLSYVGCAIIIGSSVIMFRIRLRKEKSSTAS